MEKAVEQLFKAANLNAQGGIHTVVYNTVEHVILDQIRTVVLGKTTTKHFEQYFESVKAAKALAKGWSAMTCCSPR